MSRPINDADPVFNNDFVLGLVRRHAPDAGKVTFVDEQGGTARTYHIDGNLCLKVQRPHRVRNATSIEREVFVLKQLEKEGVNNIPRSLGYGREGALEYNCMTLIPGTAVRFTKLNAKQRNDMLYELGKTVYAVHHTNLKSLLNSGLNFEAHTTPEEIRNQVWFYYNRNIGNASKGLSQEEIDEAKDRAEKLIAKITEAKAGLRHGDPSDEHTFVNNGLYSGLIDFGDSYISHPAFDLRRWPDEDRPQLLKGYMSAGPVEDSFLPVCEVIFAVENILTALSRKSA